MDFSVKEARVVESICEGSCCGRRTDTKMSLRTRFVEQLHSYVLSNRYETQVIFQFSFLISV